MAGYKVEICGVNTAKLPLLTNEEKEELFKRIVKGDKEARETYIKGNLRLVLSVIQRFASNNAENIDDLFQIGCIGLMKAVDNFDLSQGVRFSTYAVPMICGEIKRFLRDNNSIRVSRSIRDVAYKAIYAREALMKKNMKEPTIMEIADEVGASKEEVTYALDAIQSPVSLYEPVYTEGGDTLYVMDQISDKKSKEEIATKVGFYGYDRNGIPNPLKAMAREYGTSNGEAKKPFLRPAFKKKTEIEQAMQSVQDEYLPKE